MNHDLLTFAQLGHELGGVSARTARERWRNDGLPTVAFGNRELVRRLDVDAWLQCHEELAFDQKRLKKLLEEAVARARARAAARKAGS
jgi:hypothetical protein